MAFVEGVANSYADLLTALETAMLANGWTKSGAVLHADGCFVGLAVSGTTLTLRGGTGLAGGNTLQTPGPDVVRVGNAGSHMQMGFPAVYHIALNAAPREVYLHVNYAVDRWQWLAFGKSVVDLPGAGTWYAGSFGSSLITNLQITPLRGVSSSGSASYTSAGLFWGSGTAINGGCGSYIHTGIDAIAWAAASEGVNIADGQLRITAVLGGLIDRQPSALNGAATLLPCAVWQGRSGNSISLVADFAHSRVLRIDNYAPGEVLSYGSDRWRIYPFFRKNVLERDGGTFLAADAARAHTGTMGMAVRYDGP